MVVVNARKLPQANKANGWQTNWFRLESFRMTFARINVVITKECIASAMAFIVRMTGGQQCALFYIFYSKNFSDANNSSVLCPIFGIEDIASSKQITA